MITRTARRRARRASGSGIPDSRTALRTFRRSQLGRAAAPTDARRERSDAEAVLPDANSLPLTDTTFAASGDRVGRLRRGTYQPRRPGHHGCRPTGPELSRRSSRSPTHRQRVRESLRLAIDKAAVRSRRMAASRTSAPCRSVPPALARQIRLGGRRRASPSERRRRAHAGEQSSRLRKRSQRSIKSWTSRTISIAAGSR